MTYHPAKTSSQSYPNEEKLNSDSEDSDLALNFWHEGDNDSDEESVENSDASEVKSCCKERDILFSDDAGVLRFVAVPITSKTKIIRPVASPHPLSPIRSTQGNNTYTSPNDPIIFLCETSSTCFRKARVNIKGDDIRWFSNDYYDEESATVMDYEIGSSSVIERIMEEDEQFKKADFTFTNVVEVWDDDDGALAVHDEHTIIDDACEVYPESSTYRKRLFSSRSFSLLIDDPRPAKKSVRDVSYSVFSKSSVVSIDGVDLDRQLEEELNCNSCVYVAPLTSDDRRKTPVPLLTPPSSPLTVVFESGSVATLCEWPSNLIVECAMQAINELRPLSPASLELLEINEQHRVGSVFSVS